MQVSAWLWQKLMPARRRLRGKRPAGEPVVLQDPSDGGLLDGAEGPDAAGGVGPELPAQDEELPEKNNAEISPATLKKAVAELIRGQDLQALSFNQLLEKLSIAWSMSLEELEPHKEAARSILDKLVRKELARQLVEKAAQYSQAQKKRKTTAAPVDTFGRCDTNQVLLVYLCTWSAPTGSDGTKPEDYTREQVCQLMMSSLAACQANVSPHRRVVVSKMVVYREFHCNGRPHFHIAVRLSNTARWRPWKLELQNTHNINMDFATCVGGGGLQSSLALGFCDTEICLKTSDPYQLEICETHERISAS